LLNKITVGKKYARGLAIYRTDQFTESSLKACIYIFAFLESSKYSFERWYARVVVATMRPSSILAMVASLSLSCVDGLFLQKRVAGPPKVVEFSLQRRSVPDPVSRDRLRRRDTVMATLDNKVSLTCDSLTVEANILGHLVFRQCNCRNTPSERQATYRHRK